MRAGEKILPAPGVKGTETSTIDSLSYRLGLLKANPPRETFSVTTSSSPSSRSRMQAVIFMLTRNRTRSFWVRVGAAGSGSVAGAGTGSGICSLGGGGDDSPQTLVSEHRLHSLEIL